MVLHLLSAIPGFTRFSKDPEKQVAQALYRQIVEQARQPVFYASWGVPDTVEGRFEMIALHTYLVLRRLKGEDEKVGAIPQRLFDVMFDDMDDSLREQGVGDLRVGKKVRALAEDFFGRVSVMDPALDAKDEAALAEPLGRNIFEDADASGAKPLATYVCIADQALARAETKYICFGEVQFPTPKPLDE